MLTRIKMTTPLVEMDGDEMTRILWSMIKEKLIIPFVDLKTVYFDLGLEFRDKTDDNVTIEAAEAIKKYGVGVKCATITPNAERVEEYNLKSMWKSPNGTIRAILDGTVFREPIILKNIKPFVRTWDKPIIIARHAYGDVYSAVEIKVNEKGTGELVFTGETGNESKVIKKFDGPGVLQAMHNTDQSIRSFAKACFTYALDKKMDLWFATKDTISKIYDHRFKDIFLEVFENEYKKSFEESNIEFFYTLIDDVVARIIRGNGGVLWACKNYDGDVMSDMVANAFGSLAMMTSVLVSPDGHYEYEAAHGTVQRHYYKHLKGQKTSTNPVATLFAWTGALKKRGQLDENNKLTEFAEKLEKACLDLIEEGTMTNDLAVLCDSADVIILNTEDFLDQLKIKLESVM
ncbi:MAG: NADP-dependent isocitrate dehydrogenase [Clostridia bacterium]|nr:NADP-dependent isocitrate dehydrogenase [Clostridia bacterium]